MRVFAIIIIFIALFVSVIHFLPSVIFVDKGSTQVSSSLFCKFKNRERGTVSDKHTSLL
jgi:hypothetical protein